MLIVDAQRAMPECIMNVPDLSLAFDTHLHVDAEDDPAALLAAARSAGVGHFLVAGTTLEDSRRAAALAAAEPGVLAAVGVHPHEARLFDGDFDPFRDLLTQPQVAAVGEIGLDYHYHHSPVDVQRRVCEQFLAFAADVQRPVIVHCREAYADLLPMLHNAAAAGVRFVLHSFTGTATDVEALLPLGAYFGFSGMVTFRKADNIRTALQAVPPERLLAETDSPWLAPEPFRGQRNQPAYVTTIIARLAAERGLTPAAMTRLTTANGLLFFSRPAGPTGG